MKGEFTIRTFCWHNSPTWEPELRWMVPLIFTTTQLTSRLASEPSFCCSIDAWELLDSSPVSFSWVGNSLWRGEKTKLQLSCSGVWSCGCSYDHWTWDVIDDTIKVLPGRSSFPRPVAQAGNGLDWSWIPVSKVKEFGKFQADRVLC